MGSHSDETLFHLFGMQKEKSENKIDCKLTDSPDLVHVGTQ